MTCKKGIKPSFLFILLLFVASFLQAQGPDSLYTVPQSPFLAKIFSISDLNTSINLSEETNIIPLKNTSLAANGQKLY